MHYRILRSPAFDVAIRGGATYDYDTVFTLVKEKSHGVKTYSYVSTSGEVKMAYLPDSFVSNHMFLVLYMADVTKLEELL